MNADTERDSYIHLKMKFARAHWLIRRQIRAQLYEELMYIDIIVRADTHTHTRRLKGGVCARLRVCAYLFRIKDGQADYGKKSVQVHVEMSKNWDNLVWHKVTRM